MHTRFGHMPDHRVLTLPGRLPAVPERHPEEPGVHRGHHATHHPCDGRQEHQACTCPTRERRHAPGHTRSSGAVVEIG